MLCPESVHLQTRASTLGCLSFPSIVKERLLLVLESQLYAHFPVVQLSGAMAEKMYTVEIGFPQTGNLTLLPLPNFHWPGPYPHLCGLSHHSHILPSSDLALSVSCSTSFSCPILSSSQTPALPLTSPISWSRRIGETETECRCLMSATPY